MGVYVYTHNSSFDLIRWHLVQFARKNTVPYYCLLLLSVANSFDSTESQMQLDEEEAAITFRPAQ